MKPTIVREKVPKLGFATIEAMITPEILRWFHIRSSLSISTHR
jgi:hypothetical protein